MGGQQSVVRIATVVDGPWARNAEVRALFEREVRDVLRSDFTVEFADAVQQEADWTLAGVRAAIDGLLADSTVDLVITLGVIASVDVARRDSLSKPVIAPFVPDADLLGIARVDGASGMPNLVYVSHPSQIVRELQAFREVVAFEHLVILANPYYLQAIPELQQRLEQAGAQLGERATVVPLADVDDTSLSAIPRDADAVFLAWLTNLQAGENEQLLRALIGRGLPTLAFFVEDVPRGALMSLNGGSYFPRIARRVALNAQRILLGEDAASIPVEIARDEELTINMGTARAIRVYPSFSVMTEATLINEVRRAVVRETSLAAVMAEATAANLELAARERTVRAGAQEIGLARSILLPQADLVGFGRVIDENRAASSFGSQPQRGLFGGVSGSQVIFSEGAWANLSIQRSLQRGREEDLRALELDVGLEAAVAYLDVLRTKTLERIARQNLDITRSNLDLARVRVTLGSASAGEVLRWDAEVASGRQSVILANSTRNVAEIELNRILRRPLEESFGTVEATLADAPLVSGEPNVGDYIGNQYNFRIFRAFMVEEGLSGSPELQRLDAAVAAQGRQLRSAKNTYWAPTVALFGDASYRLAAGGAGSVPGSGLPPTTPVNDDLDWTVGVNFSLPLFAGAARPAEVRRVGNELASLQLQRDDVAQRVEQRVRSALHRAGASFANIRLAQDAAIASRRSFELVADAYSRGAGRPVDVLDAQNAAVIADLGAANAVYNFLIDFMEVERSVSRYQVFAGEEERASFFSRLDAYFQRAGIAPRR